MRILIISPDVIAEKMAGPGIRYYEIARILSKEFTVNLSVPNSKFLPSGKRLIFHLHHTDHIKTLYDQCDLVICQGGITKKFPFLLTGIKPLVIDLYDLIHVEELAKNSTLKRNSTSFNYLFKIIAEQLKCGDYFICASERQRDFWLGMLSALGRINPLTYDRDVTLRNLIDLVPFGLPTEEPRMTRKVIKGVYGQILPSDKVILWAGGIWDWLDPFTPIKAMHLIGEKRNDIKLYFMGTHRPFTEKALITTTTEKAVKLSKELNLYNRLVFFNEGWVPYEERQNYLMGADIGITTYKNGLETHYAWRTRLMDYLWAGLPIICSDGDSLSHFIKDKGLGVVLKHADEHELARAVLDLLNDRTMKTCRKKIMSIKSELTWEKAVAPLRAFCRSPQKAADRQPNRNNQT